MWIDDIIFWSVVPIGMWSSYRSCYEPKPWGISDYIAIIFGGFLRAALIFFIIGLPIMAIYGFIVEG